MLSRPVAAVFGLCGCLVCIGLLAFANADEPNETTVAVSRSGQIFLVEAVSRITAGRDEAWAVLTDYVGYVHFVPGMTLSRRVSDEPLRIEQQGKFGVMFFSKHVHAMLEVTETPPTRIYFHALEGNLRTLETQVDIDVDGDQVMVTYRSIIEPDFWVPPLIGTPLFRAAIRTRLEAVAQEVVWRADFGVER
ncbi:MAG: hypothetical protein JSW48_09100 [Betaproteobacteria bacterium]|jgi:carbon monoxide dehydrogenase subunit G|nr:MAG: hypothetical protein JSW48_09100 [Betaproteobacteria bacterium]